MNTLNTTRKQRGVGLIEILIVLVVLVIGWAAIAALQGKLMSGTTATKTRNIALGLAREKTEELRNSIEKGQYSLVMGAGSVNDPDNPIKIKKETDGEIASFNRSWYLTDVALENPAPIGGVAVDSVKQLVMTVSWENNEGKSEVVTLNSMIAFSDPIKMASLATGGATGGGGTVPNTMTASEGPRPGVAIEASGEDPESGDLLFDDVSSIVEIFTGTDSSGNLVVYRDSPLGENVELTVYGGKIIKFSGKIYYTTLSKLPYVRATSPSYCATFAQENSDCGITGTGAQCAKYVCYAGGDCSNGGDGCAGDLEKLPDLNGGWYGKIGDFFPQLGNDQQPTICMGDSIAVPARFYASEREYPGSTTGFEFEGVNTSFECQDTLISEHTDKNCASLIETLDDNGIKIDPNANEIEDHRAIRSLTPSTVNTVLAASNDLYDNGVFGNFCGADSGGSGDTTYSCSCSYNKKTSEFSVVGKTDPGGDEEIGCCSIEGCIAATPSIPPSGKVNDYSCSMESVNNAVPIL